MSTCSYGLDIDLDEFLIIRYIDIISIANDIMIKDFLGKDSITNIIQNLMDRGYIEKHDDYILLTDRGKKVVKEYIEKLKERGCLDKAIGIVKKLEEVNKELKDAITQWQIKVIGDMMIPNDHQDLDYDERVIHKLEYVINKIIALLKELSTYIPHFNHYIKLFKNALDNILIGRYEFIDRHPQSCHSILFICHEDWLRVFSMTRTE